MYRELVCFGAHVAHNSGLLLLSDSYFLIMNNKIVELQSVFI